MLERNQVAHGFAFVCVDSGLSLTNGRDATEVESERDLKLNKQPALPNKQFRQFISKRINDYSDSDDVFAEVEESFKTDWKEE